MSEFPLGYERVPPTTWAYLSSLLMLALYFKFTRFWSVRNLDLILIILLAPGLLMVHKGAANRNDVLREMTVAQQAEIWHPELAPEASATAESDTLNDDDSELDGEAADGSVEEAASDFPQGDSLSEPKLSEQEIAAERQLLSEWESRFKSARNLEHAGYFFLLVIGTLLLIRMLIDPIMVRRPLLEPNLSSAGLTFMGTAMLVFLFANIWSSRPVPQDLYTVGELSAEQPWWEAENESYTLMPGPGYRPLYRAPILPTFVDTDNSIEQASEDSDSRNVELLTKAVVILSLLAIVLGIVLVGYLHYDNFWTGVGIAALFLMLPYTVQMMGRVSHVFPAALLVWAIVAYRLPYLSGLLIGLATGAVYYPMFLLPLWLSFYWKRGIGRFLIGFLVALIVLVLVLAYSSPDTANFWRNLQTMFGMWWPKYDGLQGIWALGWEPVFRLPLIAGSLVLSAALMLWPTQKNLGVLMSCSCAVMVAIQFWHGYGGGLCMAWYLPLALLTIFRPNLEDRVALTVLKENRFFRRNAASNNSQAA